MDPDLRAALHDLELQVARIEQRLEGDAIALKLQFQETMRRFETLNHDARRRDERDKEFVKNDVHTALEQKFDLMNVQFQRQQEELVKKLTDISSHRLGASSTWETTMKILNIVVASAALMAMILLAVRF